MNLKRLVIAVSICLVALTAEAQRALQTERVILVTFDGLRWQELFTGADRALVDDEAFVADPGALRARFWDDDPQVRRTRLMPFFWSVIAGEGQLIGNRAHGSLANVTNNFWFSYPGYNEILTGFRDDRIESNDKIDNPNVTVLEYIHALPGFRNSVAMFGSWDVFPYIVNERRSNIRVNAGFDVAEGDGLTARESFLNELQGQIPGPWTTVRLDAFTHHYALEDLRKNTPRLVYIAYGETDDFAHDGEYDSYLYAANRSDRFVGELWRWAQSHELYRDRTTMIITTDHGRGTNPASAWQDHGTDTDGSDQIWLAVIGPDTPPLDETQTAGQYFQNQVARTVATLLGVDYDGDGKAGAAIETLIRR